MGNLAELLEPTVNGLGYDLWGLERSRRSGSELIRIYIDTESGVTVRDCETVSRQVRDVIEAEKFVPGNYVLEISSPGFERRFFSLEQHNGYIGKKIRVKLHELLDGKRVYMGILKKVSNSSIIIDSDDCDLELQFAEIERSSLVDLG